MKYVYFFDEGKAEWKDLLGGKGANLCEMTRLGLPVPPGFTITTDGCRAYSAFGEVPATLWDEVKDQLARLERESGKRLGDSHDPLLVSVRSGAKFSMPGMMDTILNLGLNDQAVQGLAQQSGNARFAWDAYRRLIQMYGDVVMNVPKHDFEEALEDLKDERGAQSDVDLGEHDLQELVTTYKSLYRDSTGEDFPQDPWVQLQGAVVAVFKSWGNRRAVTYRRLNNIPDDLGTAVNVQAMVFGNLGSDSGTGVGFTRNPSTGEREPFGEFLLNAQGEDVVAGIRTPQPLAALAEQLPDVHRQLIDTAQGLETHLRDMQDFEFTVERGKLFMLQTRNGKRTAPAAVRIAVEFAREGLITPQEAVGRVEPAALDQLLHPRLSTGHGITALTKGLPASPGAATGEVVFTADEAAELGASRDVILVTTETSPEDIHGLAAARGILTARGGMTSHAAVVARGMGKPAVVGAESIRIDRREGSMTIGDRTVQRGDIITLDGASGEVFPGAVPTEAPDVSGGLMELLVWAADMAKLGVRANADTPEDARRAREFGAVGIGLCRTEHMFFGEDRLKWVRQMILAKNEDEESEALTHLRAAQREDFKGIFEAMDGLPVTVRLLDPPLHEFLPSLEELAVKVAVSEARSETDDESRALLSRVRAMHESNPMMGLRGIRLGLTRPNITRMQARAIAEAAAELEREGKSPRPEIMIPLVGTPEELAQARAQVEVVLEEVRGETGARLDILIGTMIEIPRACVVAGDIARHADFFSFGTNDLTQMTFGYSRDDAQGKFIPHYLEHGILKADPFATLDQEGVGALVRMAVQAGRAANPNLKLGICGEHGGDPASVTFFHEVGLDYVSCSPFRVPIARLAAAQANAGELQHTTR
ncbi:pyruvate, phosphate dikinase [Deinococcus peraridilitoris]|uniref:Pyruvate, phosphate dikinase n=1 Tax=Deinococcus peraridilitoris (strain DSM 19664 / LMG 22246 / CIP 109416 / KR-200) TaxID=937777 RepID=L0A4J4_DEIPD|nr:pyruvate, phosphate dikinase [Deinococcus peraridilitoris]AFZ68354.1 pyruvate, phosphate dikinase [Deinococcus peraridilitoris DSM 19664]